VLILKSSSSFVDFDERVRDEMRVDLTLDTKGRTDGGGQTEMKNSRTKGVGYGWD